MRTLILLLSSVTVNWGFSTPCTESEHREMQTEFSECRSNLNREFHARDYNDRDADLCNMLDKIINVCAKKWHQCHSHQEIRKMKEMHTEAFIQHWERDSDLSSCHTVKRFRESLLMSNEETGPEGDCSDSESSASMSRFSSCSHATSTNVYNSILDHTTSNQITNILCTGLHNISTNCPVHLRPCFAPEDVEQIEMQHIKEMKKFFNRLMQDRIPETALDNCEVELEVPETSTAVVFEVTNPPVVVKPTTTVKPAEVPKMVKEDMSNVKLVEEETNDIAEFEAELDEDDDIKDDMLDTKSVRSSDNDNVVVVEEELGDPQPKTSPKSQENPPNSKPGMFPSGLVLLLALPLCWL